MSSLREDSIPHEQRTAAEPRQQGLYPVHLSRVEQANPSIRLLQFTVPADRNNPWPNRLRPQEDIHPDYHLPGANELSHQPFTFQPGQWLDVHIPSIANAGGFTITSTPADAAGPSPFVELAVQDSPSNPSAAWLWKPAKEILGQQVNIRVGGSFTWPPPGIDTSIVNNVLLLAGGVGINPLISILSHLNNEWQDTRQLNIKFFYSSRLPRGHESSDLDTILEQVLFLSRLREIIRSQRISQRLNLSLHLFLTDLPTERFATKELPDLTLHRRRISKQDISAGVTGSNDLSGTVSYICGPPAMTDEMVDVLQDLLGDQGDKRVFYEKWW